ncbi:MAG: Uma2 family endonuclease [Gemmataceae bacterium]|nr:Uma2 family endonuclease [Gemmataceae bacterium]
MSTELMSLPQQAPAAPGTSATALEADNASKPRRPTWEIAQFFPEQGSWTENDYLSLESKLGHNIRVELANGWLEVLPVATEIHQDLILYLVGKLKAFAEPAKLGKTSFAGIRVRTIATERKNYREPDVAFMKSENAHRRSNETWQGADLVMEVVSGSPDDRKRDYEIKVIEYAAARIAEYWIIDPDERRFRVLTLDGDAYKVHGDFAAGATASSVLLPGFAVSVDEAFAAGQ